MEETLIKTNTDVLKRMTKILNSGLISLPLGAKPGDAKLKKVCANASMHEYWYTISMGNWQYLTPNQMQIVNKISPSIDDQTLFMITKMINRQNKDEQAISNDELYKIVKDMAQTI